MHGASSIALYVQVSNYHCGRCASPDRTVFSPLIWVVIRAMLKNEAGVLSDRLVVSASRWWFHVFDLEVQTIMVSIKCGHAHYQLKSLTLTGWFPAVFLHIALDSNLVARAMMYRYCPSS